MIVSQILSQKPSGNIITVSPTDTIENAVARLSKHRIGALIVSSEGTSVDGILSERDIVQEMGQTGAKALSCKVGDLMTADVVACMPGDSAVSVLERMTAGRFRHMPVVDQSELIGVISIGDVVKARIEEVESENTALTGMIAGYS